MKKFISSMFSGLFFAIPLGLIVYVFGKLFRILEKIISPIAHATGIQGIFGEFTLSILSVVVFALFCFVLGLLLQRAAFLRVLGESVEGVAVRVIPSLSFLKSMADEKFDIQAANSWKGALLEEDGNWRPAYIVEESAEWLTLLIPEPPKGDGGEIRIVPSGSVNLRHVDLTTIKIAFTVYGRGLQQHLK